MELNGFVILDTELSKAEGFMVDSRHPGLKNTEGYFGFAGHGDPVMFRNGLIKETK